MLVFSKAFNTVPYQHLLKKLSSYRVDGKLHHWLSMWLTKDQRELLLMDVNQNMSGYCLVFQVIYHILSFSLKLFADDCIIYQTIKF